MEFGLKMRHANNVKQERHMTEGIELSNQESSEYS